LYAYLPDGYGNHPAFKKQGKNNASRRYDNHRIFIPRSFIQSTRCIERCKIIWQIFAFYLQIPNIFCTFAAEI